MENFKIVQVNTGRATHLKHETAGIICGGSTASNKKRIERPTGLKGIENVTCKKCLAAYEKEFKQQAAAPIADQELSLREYCEKFGRSFVLAK